MGGEKDVGFCRGSVAAPFWFGTEVDFQRVQGIAGGDIFFAAHML